MSEKNNNNKGDIKKYIACDLCGEYNPSGSDSCKGCGVLLEGRSHLVESTEEAEHTTEKKSEAGKLAGKKIEPVKLYYIAFGFLLISIILMFIGGVFDSPQPGVQSFSNMNRNPHSHDDMAAFQKISDMENALKADPANYDLMLDLAHLQNDSGLEEKAIENYLKYLENFPSNADVWIDLGVCYYKINNLTEAFNTMQKGIEINPSHQIAHFNIGIVKMAEGKTDEAKKWWRKVIEINPDNEISKKAKEFLNTH